MEVVARPFSGFENPELPHKSRRIGPLPAYAANSKGWIKEG
jgi:hypothetical protein